MKEKILEILNSYKFNTTDQAGTTYMVVEESDFEQIAEELLQETKPKIVYHQSELTRRQTIAAKILAAEVTTERAHKMSHKALVREALELADELIKESL